MLLEQKLASHQQVITAEITPPKGVGIKKLTKHGLMLKPYVDAINVTDCQRALVKMASWAACRVLEDLGIPSVFQLTCRDRNTIALQADLMGANALGISNLLCLTGDPVKVGDSPDSKSVFEIESIKLLQIVQSLQAGKDKSGAKMNAPTKFFVGAVVNPTMQSNQLNRMEKKIEAGARFFQTQANYDIDDFQTFLKAARAYQIPVLAGILILTSYEVAQYIHENIPGIKVPDSVLARFKSATDGEAEGIEFALETMLRLENDCAGFHVMTIRNEELIPKLMEKYRGRTSLKNPAL